jgi:hypothetical protein
MYDPEGTNTGHSDWIELYNNSENKIEIQKNDFGIIDEKDLVLGKDGIKYVNCHQINKNIEINSKEFIVLADNENNFKNDYPATTSLIVDTILELSYQGDTIHLSQDGCVTFFAEGFYEKSWGAYNNGKTLEKIDLNKGNEETNWKESYISGGTPGYENFSGDDKPTTYSDKIRINELLPKPIDGEKEFVELYNFSDEEMNLVDWKLKDKGGNICDLEGIKIKSNEYLAIKESDECNIALNDSGGDEMYLYNPKDENPISSVKYSENAKENYSYSFDGAKWKWTSSITPNAENQFDEPIETKIKKDKTVYRNTYAEFEVSTNKKSAKVTWDFGDGHKSYKEKTRHKYEKAGKYRVTAKISGGSEDKIEEFTIKVEKFPEKAVKIIGLVPNPKGKDTTTENIIVWNKSKKKVNLKDWSVATGWKNLYNHPISKDFILKPGEKKILSRNFSNFALNNKKTKVELRYPDGKIASKTKYDKKTETVKEGEVYEKTGTEWAWKKVALPNTTRLAKAEPKPTENNNIQLASAIMKIKDSDLIIPQEYIGKQSIDNILPKQNIVVASYSLNNSTMAEKIAQGIFNGINPINFSEKNNENKSFIQKITGGVNYWMNKIITKFI